MRSRASREVTTQMILDAAEELFSRNDPAKVTVRQIAEKAGVTHPLVHQYVGTKEDILLAVIARGAPARQDILASTPDPREALRLAAVDVLEKRISSRAILRAAMDDDDYAVHEHRRETMRMLHEIVEGRLSEGEARPASPPQIDSRIALAASVALVFGWSGVEDWMHDLLGIEDDPQAVREIIAQLAVHLMELSLPQE